MAIYKSKSVSKDGRKWYYSVFYITADGRRKRKKSQRYKSRPEAQEAERQFLIDNTGQRLDLTFEEMYYQYLNYIDEKIKESSKYSKISWSKIHILNYFGKINIHNITVNTIISWRTILNQATYGKNKIKYSKRYKNNIFIELRAALKYGVNFCGLKENVASKIMLFQDKDDKVISDEDKIRYITPSEYNLFSSVIENKVYKTFFAFLYYMGVRRGEAQALNWEDIYWDTNQVRIIKTITKKTDELDEYGHRFKITNTKNRNNRTIKMPLIIKNMLFELWEYYTEFEGFNDKWFVFGGDKHLPSQSIAREKDRCFSLVKETYKGINRITIHEFRHSHASYLISKGVRAELIANRLGDTVEIVMQTYAHLFPEAEDGIIEELDLIEDQSSVI